MDSAARVASAPDRSAGRSAAYFVQASGGMVQELAVVDSQLVQRAATLGALVSQIP